MQPSDHPVRVERVDDAPRASTDVLEELYERSRRRLAGQVFAMTGDWQRSFDVVQEAFVRTWERWDRVCSYENPEAYVRRVAFNLATSQWRRLRRLVHATAERAEEPVDAESRFDLVAALRTLPASEREAIVLHYVADVPIDQIAREMKAPVGTVKSWLSRGRSRLAERLTLEECKEVTSHG